MDNFTTYLHRIKETVCNRTQESISNLVLALAAEMQDDVRGNDSHISLEDKTKILNNNPVNQKVLEIDVIESGYILKTEENLGPLTHEKN